ncbi:DNA kinase/phosphatase Pnk1 [Saitoella coloradoensis]
MSIKRPAQEDLEKSSSSKKMVTSTTTKAAVASFFAPASKRLLDPDGIKWATRHGTLLVAKYKGGPLKEVKEGKTYKVGAFDLDGTLIKTTSGSRFAKDANDWTWWHPSVPTLIRSLHASGYLIAIFSNQGGISLKTANSKSETKWKTKLEAVCRGLNVPVAVYGATGRDRWRKPRVGMWEEFVGECGLGESEGTGRVDMEGSFYVGDAAGRGDERSKDFSCSDRRLAMNIGIKFHTPEEYFLGTDPEPYSMKNSFDPLIVLSKEAPTTTFTKRFEQELIVMVGSPASGKSTYTELFLEPLGYVRVNQDTLKTREKCVKVAEAALLEGQDVVVDNTNADAGTRKVWIELASRLKSQCPELRCEHGEDCHRKKSEIFYQASLLQVTLHDFKNLRLKKGLKTWKR